MSKPKSFERAQLDRAYAILTAYSTVYEKQLLAIEVCASFFGNFSIKEYWSAFSIVCADFDKAKEVGFQLFQEISKTSISPSMAIASLSREPIPDSEKKKHGVYYTDYRLAEFVSENCSSVLKKNSKVTDLAAGSGILLAGVADLYYNKYNDYYDKWISENVYAFDLSYNALRGARAAIAVHISSLDALLKMYSNWAVCDSLITNIIPDNSFDIVIGNPPWGKVKLSLHTFLNSSGQYHIYGSSYSEFDKKQFEKNKLEIIQYSKLLKDNYSLIENAEPDMYMAFLQKALTVLKSHGRLIYIIPAGIIRSKGTEALRRYLIKNSSTLRYYLFDNKARFFEIDTRFKFVVIKTDKKSPKENSCSEFSLSICNTKNALIDVGDNIDYNVCSLEKARPDLTVPECRSIYEKDLFFKICNNGMNWYHAWSPKIMREVDMTNCRHDFEHICSEDSIPVIEGRMIQQYRFGAKAYVSGSGRSAVWVPVSNRICSQYYYNRKALPKKLHDRIQFHRIGYCDIAGQTNERAMMCAVVPPDVVCGNKVPTILFPNDDDMNYLYLWIGIANSFVFDWFVRRIISTTLNFFLLFSVPFPKICVDDKVAQEIINKTKELSHMQSEYYLDRKMNVLRAEIDVLVAQAYGLDFSDIEIIMKDFPLLDRGQQALEHEKASTITRDLVLSLAEKAYDISPCYYNDRVKEAEKLNTQAYIPSEMKVLCSKG